MAATGFESRGVLGQTQTQTKSTRRKSSSGSNNSNSAPHTTSLHTHRQNHNSSKLPAFRFADLNSVKPSVSLPLPSLLQHIPPSPVSPNPGTVPGASSGQGPLQEGTSSTSDPHENTPVGATEIARPTTHQGQPSLKKCEKPSVVTPPDSTGQQTPSRLDSIARSRASTFQQSTTISKHSKPAATAKRPASFPASPTKKQGSSDERTNPPTGAAAPGPATNQNSNNTITTAAANLAKPLQTRRAPASFSSNGIETSSGPPPSLNTHRLHAVEAAAQVGQPPLSTDKSTKEWAQGQRELLLPKALQQSPTDDRRASTTSRPPPVSFKPHLINAASTPPVKVPPIRGFRSSGSRRSLILDMNVRTMRQYDVGDDVSDSNQRDRTLRALEGRPEDDMGQITPPDSAARDGADGDDTGDVFLKIAREESSRRVNDEGNGMEEPGALSRVVRSSHRRPYSAATPSYQPASPPRITRRLSDQQETVRVRKMEDDQSADHLRGFAYRGLGRDKAASIHPGEDLSRRISTSIRQGPNTPRSLAFQDTSTDNGTYGRRRPSISESTTGVPARTASYRQSNLSYGQHRAAAYSSSPLVPRLDNTLRVDQHGYDGHGIEGTESTASTTGPSTVWDELDDLKSRINRLELTGKLPPTSGAAMSRVSDERPVTANTTVTNNSTSPKRISGGAGQDASSSTSSQREAHPILHTALAKSKPFLTAEVYKALEAAAMDALALSSMMGSVGQGAPLSSGASTIGGTNVTDRQIRRKADSVCRSLTELCLALSEESARPKTSHANGTPQKEGPTTPTTVKSFAGISAQRRPSAVAEQGLTRANTVATSPRAMTRLEERRNNLLNATALPSPRIVAPTPATPTDTSQGRRSSLLIARRRAGTEEPEEGRKSSLLLRTRRAGTEEPEEGRKTSFLHRPRRGTVGDDDEETRFRAPSRAVTEVQNARVVSRDYAPNALATNDSGLGSSALPRRRLGPSTLNSRLAAPSSAPSAIPAARRYADRDGNSNSNSNSNSVVDKLAEDRGQRPLSLGQTAMLNRTGSLNRRNRDSMIGMPSPAATSTYR